MNYYIQGDAANADQIKAAFENKGFIKEDHRDIYENNVLFFTVNGDKNVHYCWIDQPYSDIIKTHPDYQELGLPKPHYDISNLNPFDKKMAMIGFAVVVEVLLNHTHLPVKNLNEIEL